MAGTSWMVVQDGTQLEGKYSTEQLRQMMANSPQANFFVWREGLSQWVDPTTQPELQTPDPGSVTRSEAPVLPPPQTHAAPAEEKPKDEAAEKFKEGGKAILEGAAAQFSKIRDAEDSHAYLPHLKLLDGLLNFARKLLSGSFLDKIDDYAIKFGNVGLIVAAIFLFLGSLITAVKSSDYMSTPLMGFLTLLVLCLAQYVAVKFLGAGKTLIEKSPSRLSSNAFLECIALLGLLAAIGTFGSGLVMAIQMKTLAPFLAGLGASLVLLYLTGIALNGETVSVRVAGDASAGEEAIGIYAFLLKSILRLVPFAFGVGMIGFALFIIYSVVLLPFKSDIAFSMASGAVAASAIPLTYLAIMPFAIYIAVLVLYLTIDVIRATLVIPGKLDRLRESRSLDSDS